MNRLLGVIIDPVKINAETGYKELYDKLDKALEPFKNVKNIKNYIAICNQNNMLALKDEDNKKVSIAMLKDIDFNKMLDETLNHKLNELSQKFETFDCLKHKYINFNEYATYQCMFATDALVYDNNWLDVNEEGADYKDEFYEVLMKNQNKMFVLVDYLTE